MIDPKDVAIVTPGAIAVAASWLGIVNTVLSIAFISASLAFLIAFRILSNSCFGAY